MNNAKYIDELVDTVTEYMKFNIEMLLPKKTVKQYPNNKPRVTSEPRKKVVDKHQAHTNKAEDHNVKQLEVNEAINKAKLLFKDQVEHLFETPTKRRMEWTKDPNSQKEDKKAISLTSTPEVHSFAAGKQSP